MRIAAIKGETGRYTSGRWLHSARQAEPAEAIIEYLIVLERRGGVVGDLDTGRQSVEDPVSPQDRLRLRRDQYARLSVPKYVVLLQDTCGNPNMR